MIEGLDPEVSQLVKAINRFPGIQTIDSCCGHGEHPFNISFIIDDLDALPPLLYWFDGCHTGYYGWEVIVTTDCAMMPVHFLAEGPAGAYDEADNMARQMNDYLEKVKETESNN